MCGVLLEVQLKQGLKLRKQMKMRNQKCQAQKKSLSGLLGTGGTFQMPFNRDVTIEFSIDPLRFPLVSPRLLFKQTIKAGTVKSGSTRYRYLSRDGGIRELRFDKSGNNVYLSVWVEEVNLLTDLKATLSQDEYLAFVSEGIKSYNITVRIDDQTWSGNAPLKKTYFGAHKFQLSLNP